MIAALAVSSETKAQPACTNNASATASVDFVTKARPVSAAPGTPFQPPNNSVVDAALQDTIFVHVDKLNDMLTEFDNCLKTQPTKQLVLYLNGLALKDLTGTLPLPRADGFLEFQLVRTSAAKDAWTRILSPPWPINRDVAVSVGFADQYPINSGKVVHFQVVHIWKSLLAIVFLAIVVIVLVHYARTTSLLRDGSATSSYSLARTQAAWWFIVILAGYILIAAVTGDFNGTLSGTALTLLGIGAATAGASAVVSISKEGEQHEALQRVAAQVDAQADQVAAAQEQMAAAPGNAAIVAVHNDAVTQLQETADLLGKLNNLDRNEHFLRDILSDADGINIHRFQMVAWTLVLTFIFAEQIVGKLAMPEFDANLLTLQGISAATYVGLKMAEPSVPKEARK
jgi:hypothetical protein